MCYDEEQYFEPSLADEILSEYTEKMKEVLTDNAKAILAELRDKNKQLQERNKYLQAANNDLNNKLNKTERDKDEIRRQLRQERLSELMKDFEVVMYQVYNKGKKHPKCDKCNDERKIEFLSPNGKQMYESCPCDKAYPHYVPKEFICSEFKLYNGKLLAWYKRKMCDNDDEYYTLDNSTFSRTVYSNNMDYEKINKYETFFKTEEECKKYCDWLNKSAV